MFFLLIWHCTGGLTSKRNTPVEEYAMSFRKILKDGLKEHYFCFSVEHMGCKKSYTKAACFI